MVVLHTVRRLEFCTRPRISCRTGRHLRTWVLRTAVRCFMRRRTECFIRLRSMADRLRTVLVRLRTVRDPIRIVRGLLRTDLGHPARSLPGSGFHRREATGVVSRGGVTTGGGAMTTSST